MYLILVCLQFLEFVLDLFLFDQFVFCLIYDFSGQTKNLVKCLKHVDCRLTDIFFFEIRI